MKDNNPVTDQELLDRIANKDNEAFAIFYRRHYPFIARRVKKLMPDEDLAKDFIQEFWIQLWEKPTMLKTNEKGSVFNFLYSFLFTFVLLARRLNETYASRISSLEELNMPPQSLQYTHVLEDVEVAELIQFIDSITEQFPEPQYTIYDLYKQNYSLAYVADSVHLSEGSVRNHLTRIFKTIRGSIYKQYRIITAS